MRYFYLLLPFIVLINAITAKAQGWSTPVNVSNMGNFCNNPKMTVDHNGVIHAVWSMTVTQQYRKIMYAKSENQGDVWSEPVAIADDSLQWFALPDIACDLQNRLYVSYEGDAMAPGSTSIYITIFDGNQWNTPFIISENMYGSNNSLVVTDNAGRLYCFWHAWYNNEVKLIYKYLEDGLWSQSIIPYTQNGEFFWIKKIVSDSTNNLHCVGTHHYNNESRYDDRVVYCYYLRSSNQWAPIENISDTTNRSWQGNSIDIDNNAIPHFAWGQFIKPYPSSENGILYRFPDASGWLPVDSVVLNHNSYSPEIVVDNSDFVNVLVIQRTISNVLNQIIHYRQTGTGWVGSVVDTVHAFMNAGQISENSIAVIYVKPPIGEVLFSKYDIYTEIPPSNLLAAYISIIPNPFNWKTEINYIVHTTSRIVIDIFDINGKLITRLTGQTQSPGQYCILWQGVGANAKEVSKGLYFVRLQAGSNVYTCKIAKQ